MYAGYRHNSAGGNNGGEEARGGEHGRAARQGGRHDAHTEVPAAAV